MDKETLASIIEASEEKRRELRVQLDDTRVHFLKQGRADPMLPGQVVVLNISYEQAALAYPWPSLEAPGIELPHDHRYKDKIPHIEMGVFREDMQKQHVRIEDMGVKNSLLDERFRLVIYIEP